MTAGTLFAGTKLPLTTWFLAIYLISQAKTGLSAFALKRQFGVSYPTAWLVHHKIMCAMPDGRRKTAIQKQEHRKASVRAKVEHPFRVIKRQFGLTKVRFRGLAKNTAHVVTLFAVSNLWMVRRQLLAKAAVRPHRA